MCFSCYGNNLDFNKFRTACKVCELVDGDMMEKPTVYCEICKAYICADCINDWIRRGKAMVLNWGRK